MERPRHPRTVPHAHVGMPGALALPRGGIPVPGVCPVPEFLQNVACKPVHGCPCGTEETSPSPRGDDRGSAQRLTPSCPSQYLLSPETIEGLRKPTFDVWLWEPNEVSEGAPGTGVSGTETSPSLSPPGLSPLCCFCCFFHLILQILVKLTLDWLRGVLETELRKGVSDR